MVYFLCGTDKISSERGFGDNVQGLRRAERDRNSCNEEWEWQHTDFWAVMKPVEVDDH